MSNYKRLNVSAHLCRAYKSSSSPHSTIQFKMSASLVLCTLQLSYLFLFVEGNPLEPTLLETCNFMDCNNIPGQATPSLVEASLDISAAGEHQNFTEQDTTSMVEPSMKSYSVEEIPLQKSSMDKTSSSISSESIISLVGWILLCLVLIFFAVYTVWLKNCSKQPSGGFHEQRIH